MQQLISSGLDQGSIRFPSQGVFDKKDESVRINHVTQVQSCQKQKPLHHKPLKT